MRMAPRGRKPTDYYLNLDTEYRNGCVLCHIFPIKEYPYITFIKRIENGKAHSGQIAFPGGRADENDKTLQHTALREAYEEVALNPNEVNIIGRLSSIYIPVSRYIVHPFVSCSNDEPAFKICEAEVQAVIPVSIKELLNPAIVRTFKVKTSDGLITEAPCFAVGRENIWGATAMMLNELLEMSRKFFLLADKKN